MWHASFVASLVLIGSLTAGCRGESTTSAGGAAGSVASATTAATSAAVRASAAPADAPPSSAAPANAPPSGAVPGLSASPSASAPAGTGADSSPWLGPPRLPGTKRRDTVKDAGGLLIGVPAGWSAEDVYDAYALASFQVSGLTHVMAYYLASSSKAPITDPPPVKELERLAYVLRTVKTTWELTPTAVRVGPEGYVGSLVRGHGQGLSASEGTKDLFYIEVDVPGRKRTTFMGSWMTRFPEHEDQLREMLRGLQPCAFKAGRGCVPVDAAPAASASAGR